MNDPKYDHHMPPAELAAVRAEMTRATDDMQNGVWFAVGALHGRAAKLAEAAGKLSDGTVTPLGRAGACRKAAAELVAVARWINSMLRPELRITDQQMAELVGAIELDVGALPEITLTGDDVG